MERFIPVLSKNKKLYADIEYLKELQKENEELMKENKELKNKESALCDEDKLEQFLLDNIKIEGNL